MASSQSFRFRTSVFLAAASSFVLGGATVQCGGSSGQNSTDGSGGGSSFNTTGTNTGTNTGTMSGGTLSAGVGGNFGPSDAALDYTEEQFFQNDPPPMTCDGGGMPPPPPGGTPQCPDDKNLPGCPCATAGETAACWTGLRKDRGIGDCKDGMTTCTPSQEVGVLAWGPCNGEVLPVDGGTGKAACQCFSAGQWAIANLSPCFVTDSSGNVTEAISTVGDPAMCPSDFSMAPATWSTDTLKVDCSGTFTLCYTIKAGDPKNPQPTDCVISKSCVTSYYPTAGMVFDMPDLAGWITDSSMTACAQQFYDTGGYGEMSVDGQSDECELVQKVFQTIPYCPLACNTNPNGPGCMGCQNGGSGMF